MPLFWLHEKEACQGIFSIHSALQCAGISYKLFPGNALWNPVVGLQRTLFKYQRADLPAWRDRFWTWRRIARLPVPSAL